MRRLASFILLFAASAFLVACDDSEEVLAEYDGGVVTRGELRVLFYSRFGPLAEEQATTEIQSNAVRSIALTYIQAMEAEAAGMESDPRFQSIAHIIPMRAQLVTYQYAINSEPESIKFDMLYAQGLALRRTQDDPTGREGEIQEIQNKLNNASDPEIKELVYRHSDNRALRFSEGFIQPLCSNCQSDVQMKWMTRPLSEAEDGKFIRIDAGEMVFVVRRVDRKELEYDDLRSEYEDYFAQTVRVGQGHLAEHPELQSSGLIMSQSQIEQTSQQMAERMIREEFAATASRRIDDLRAEKDLTIQPAGMVGTAQADVTPDTSLFAIGDETYTVADLKNDLPGDGLEYGEKVALMHRIILPHRLLSTTEDYQEVVNNDAFPIFMRQARAERLSELFVYEQRGGSDITEQDIRQAYERMRATAFPNQSYAEARPLIKQQLENQQFQMQRSVIQEDLTQKYNLKIFADRIEANRL